jgi:DNA-binding transcriptional ArsR family regulator
MARSLDPQVAEKIVQIVEQHPEGATIEQIEQVIDVPRRTLQRRLAELVANGRARAIGRGKQRRYQLAAHDSTRPEELPVSRSGREVRSRLAGEVLTLRSQIVTSCSGCPNRSQIVTGSGE